MNQLRVERSWHSSHTPPPPPPSFVGEHRKSLSPPPPKLVPPFDSPWPQLAPQTLARMYIYDLATTGTISFTDFLVTTDLVSQVSQTTQLRARLRAVLKENRAGTSSAAVKDVSSSKDIRTNTASGSSRSGGDDASSSAGGAVATAGNASDWLTIVKTIEEYLPHILAIFNCVQTDDLILRYEPVFSWRTSISGTRFRGPQRIDLPGLYYELASTLLTYALTLSNFAAATVASLGSFERDRTLSAEQRKSSDQRLRWAADTLCRAAGILLYLSTDLLPKWSDHVGRVDGLPPDLTTEATLALSKICLAEAQALAIRKLISPSVAKAVDTVTPGPPLQKDHPSASLLAKLHLNVVEEMESALGLLKTVGEKGKRGKRLGGGGGGGGGGRGEMGLSANHEDLARRVSGSRDRHAEDGEALDAAAGASGGKGKKLFGKFKLGNKSSAHDSQRNDDAVHHLAPPIGRENTFYSQPTAAANAGGVDRDLDISPWLVKYLLFSTTFHKSMAYKWLAIDHGESSSRFGQAIAYLSLSSSLLSSSTLRDTGGLANVFIASSSSSLLLPKSRKPLSSSSAIVDQESATVAHWLSSYRKLNDTVAFQPVASTHEILAKIPAGRAALGVKKYTLPSPGWGPGSDGYAGKGDVAGLALDRLHLLDADHPARTGLLVGIASDGIGSSSRADRMAHDDDADADATPGVGGGGAGREASLPSSSGGATYAGQGAYY